MPTAYPPYKLARLRWTSSSRLDDRADLPPRPLDVPHAVRFRTPRLVIRRWSTADADGLAAAIESNLEHLQRWLAWARAEPAPQAEHVMRLARFARDFDRDRDWSFALLTSDEQVIVGGAGLHGTGRDDTLEVGCWLCADVEGLGLASEATMALCHEAFFRRGMSAVSQRCDPHNARAIRLAERMGFVRLDDREALGLGQSKHGGDEPAVIYLLRRDEVAVDSPVHVGGAVYEDDGTSA